jgi:hypothetical protein
VTFTAQIYIVGDINIHLELPDDSAACKIRVNFTAHGLSNCVSSPTHHLGGLLDVVVCRSDLPAQSVDVIDVWLSDHHLLRWSVPLEREAPVFITSSNRSWRRLDSTNFRSAVVASLLCDAGAWSSLDVNELAQLYSTELTSILDRLVPVQTIKCRRRACDAVLRGE